MQFESPGRLEQRIAANMADESDDLSLGVARRAPSMGSLSSVTDEASFSRGDDGDESTQYYDDVGQRSNPNTDTIRSGGSSTAVLRPANRRVNVVPSGQSLDASRAGSSKASASSQMISSNATSRDQQPKSASISGSASDDEASRDNDESNALEPQSLRRRGPDESAGEAESSAVVSSPSSEKLARRTRSTTPSSTRGSPAMATMTPRAKPADQERMKAYLLNSVKNINPLREQQLRHMTPKRNLFGTPEHTPGDASSIGDSSPAVGAGQSDRLGRVNAMQAGRTPLPSYLHRPSPLSAVSNAATPRPGGTDTDSQISDTSSTRDLTVPARMRPNTSFPGVGIQDGAHNNGGARVDSARLQGYLHKINIQLEEENVVLKEEVETLRRQFNKALKDNERLRSEAEPGEDDGQSGSTSSSKYARARIEELEHGQNELNDLLDEREDELAQAQDKIEELETKLSRGGQGEAGRNDTIVEELRDRIAELEEEQQHGDREKSQAGGFEERLREAMKEADDMAREAEEVLIKERDNIAKELDEVRAQLQAAEARHNRAGRREAETNTSTDEEVGLERIERLERRLAESEFQREEAIDREAKLDELCKEMEDKIVELEQELGDQHDLIEQVKELDEENIRLDEAILKAHEELDDAKSRLSDMGIAVDEKENEIQRLTMQLRQTQPNKDGKIGSEPSRAEFAALKDKLLKLEAELAEANKPLSGPEQPTPVHRSIAALKMSTLRTPKSPGELSNASWLYNESSLGDRGVVEHIHELEQKLDDANASIDEKLQELDRQGMSHMTLARKLADAHLRNEALEKELASLQGRGSHLEAIKHRLARIQCPGCRSRFDGREQVRVDSNASAAAAPGADESSLSSVGNRSAMRSSTASRAEALQAVSTQLEELKRRWAVDMAKLTQDREALQVERKEFTAERSALQGENRRLREKAIEADVGRREAARKVQEATQKELQRAKEAIVSFEAELRGDRNRLQALLRQSASSADVSTEVEIELGRTEARLREVDRELKSKVEMHERLQEELLEKSQVGQELPWQVYMLEAQVRQLSNDVGALRKERSAILDQRQRLHAKFRSEHDRMENAYAELSLAREAMLAHQVQLDEQIETIEGLHAALMSRNRELESAVDDRDRLKEQRREILDDVGLLESDLKRVREESERFGIDLQRLREEKSRMKEEQRRMDEERAKVEKDDAAKRHERQRQIEMEQRRIEDQIKISQLTEKLEEVRRRATEDGTRLHEEHRRQCQGLMLQIRYLKAKLGRESDLRQDVVHQKSYLLQLVGGLELGEEATNRFVADLQRSRRRHQHGVAEENAPRSKGQEARRRWAKVQTVVLAVCRARLMAKNWAQTRRVGAALKEAHWAAKKESGYRQLQHKQQQQQQS